MKYWVCKTHQDQELFSEEDVEKARRLGMAPLLKSTPRECPKCSSYYYREQCLEKER